jgi:hypothetical protein
MASQPSGKFSWLYGFKHATCAEFPVRENRGVPLGALQGTYENTHLFSICDSRFVCFSRIPPRQGRPGFEPQQTQLLLPVFLRGESW